MGELFHNHVLLTVAIASLAAQCLKGVLCLSTEHRWDLTKLLDTGGMPSAHTTAVSALTICVGHDLGWGSTFFAMTVVFSYIVMYDAANLRRAAGQQAELLNQLVLDLQHLLRADYRPQTMKTLLGHTYPQVIAGLLLGVIVATVSYL